MRFPIFVYQNRKRMKYRLSACLLAVVAILASCSPKPVKGTAVLTAEILGDCSEVLVLTYPNNDILDYRYPEVVDGKFRLVLEDVNGFIDCGVALDGEVYGARINAGDSLHMVCTPVAGGKYDIAYVGDTEKESRIWTDFYDVYCYWGQYNIRADRDPAVSTEDALALLDRRDAGFREKYGETIDDYYLRRADLTTDFLKMLLYESDASDTGRELVTYPEYVEIADRIDPEDPLMVACSLVPRWVNENVGKLSDDPVEGGIAFMEGAGSGVVLPESRAAIAKVLCSMISINIDLSRYEKYVEFLDKVEACYPESGETVARYREQLESTMRASTLTEMPDVSMEAPDGSEVMLSSLFGKVLYIDMWATWCGPCLKEAPYFKELAERYKKDGRFAFISISVDETAKPWLAKLDEEKPFWPQYRIDNERGKSFFKSINLQTIPRFIIVDVNGNVFDVDAPRPSNKGIVEALEKAAAR